MAGVAAYKASIQGQIPSNHAEVLECMEKIEWDTFDEFTCLGSLASMIPFVDDADVKSSLEKLGRITARLKGYRTDRLPSLYVYLALSVSDRTKEGDISGQELHDFYKQVFHSTLREDNMHNFFRQHATIMIVRRFYYRQKSFRLEIVGALTFSRPTDRVPTYLAYVAVSSGRHNYPSLHQTVSQIIPANCFPEGEDLTGFRGRGLGLLLICLMEALVRTSQRLNHKTLPRRQPYPECYLHYNSNNEESGDGWLKHGFLKLYGDTECSDEEIATVRGRYTHVLARSLNGCNIFKASHLDAKNSTTMYTKFNFEVDDPNTFQPPPFLYNDNDWYADYSPTLAEPYQAEELLHPLYALDVDEIEAKYARKDGDPIDAKLDVIIEAAFKRKKFCVNTVLSDLDEDESDDDDSDADDQEPPSKKAKKKKK